MVFSSITFLFYFLPAFLLLYSMVPSGKPWSTRASNVVLLMGSLLFYAWGAPRFIFVLLTSTVIDFYLVGRMARTEDAKWRKRWLLASLVMNLGLLAVFKYADFLTGSALAVVGREWKGWGLVLPIGISFYTFQTLTYALDVYRRDEQPLRSLLDYLVYILSFPQMIAGPIVRFGKVAREIRQRHVTGEDRLQGLYRFSIGLGKKMLLANFFAILADGAFDGGLHALTTAGAWMGVLAYHYQIYFDFSGYSDMAIGLGRMLGFRFPENFRSPYVSRSITEFWRRWHITLGDFMRDYLYIPLGGNRSKTTARRYFNLAFVFLASGLWHGAEWHYVVWGAGHGVMLVLDRLFLRRFLERIPLLAAVLFNHFVLMQTWVMFRLGDWQKIGLYYRKMFSFELADACTWHVGWPDWAWIVLPIGAGFSLLAMLPVGQKWEDQIFNTPHFSARGHLAMALTTGTLLWLAALEVIGSQYNPFIYFQF